MNHEVVVVSEGSTPRGFALIEFLDFNGHQCSLQKSSIAEYDAVWFGTDDPDPKILASKARAHGVETNETTGWVSFPVPEEVLMTTRMHLTRSQVAELLPYLRKFVETGEIEPHPENRGTR